MARYEDLRQQAMGHPGCFPSGQGMVLLMRSGMRVWMQAWAHCTVPDPPARQDRLGIEQIIPLEMQNEMTMILAGMILTRRQEARL